MVQLLVDGFVSILAFDTLFAIFAGIFIGLIFGSIPGLTATMAIVLGLPITFGLTPIVGMSLLLGLYLGGVSGGCISAILMGIPGTPASIGTVFDGYPMAQKGEADKALSVVVLSSFFGGLISIVILSTIAPPVARFALRFGFYAYFSVALFALTMVGSLSSKSVTKGLIGGIIGLFLGTFGNDPIGFFPRFSFGFYQLQAGFDLLPVLIGLFAVPQVISMAERPSQETHGGVAQVDFRGVTRHMGQFFTQKLNCVISALIGTFVGILPGVGASSGNLISYSRAKNQSKYPEKFGTGIIDGLVATESANNAVVGGALVPLMTLGIPGDAATAMLLGGLMIHGLMPGPMLFVRDAELVYGIFASLMIGNLLMLVLFVLGMRLFVRLLSVPRRILIPIIIVLCVVGSIGLNNRVFDASVLMFFGFLGYGLEKIEVPIPPVVLGFILSPIIETNLRRGIMQSRGDFSPFFTDPVSAFFLVLTALSVVFFVWRQIRQHKRNL